MTPNTTTATTNNSSFLSGSPSPFSPHLMLMHQDDEILKVYDMCDVSLDPLRRHQHLSPEFTKMHTNTDTDSSFNTSTNNTQSGTHHYTTSAHDESLLTVSSIASISRDTTNSNDDNGKDSNSVALEESKQQTLKLKRRNEKTKNSNDAAVVEDSDPIQGGNMDDSGVMTKEMFEIHLTPQNFQVEIALPSRDAVCSPIARDEEFITNPKGVPTTTTSTTTPTSDTGDDVANATDNNNNFDNDNDAMDLSNQAEIQNCVDAMSRDDSDNDNNANDVIVKPEVADTKIKPRKKPATTLFKWLIQSAVSSKAPGLQVVVGGVTCQNVLWHTSPIRHRLTVRHLASFNGSEYVLEGPMDVEATRKAGFHRSISRRIPEALAALG
eukprot:c23271_g1_i1.p1 GENE.c23271_g1_i1~~c23271_g1_i1.p1  ORF type:complete len:422 (-),score=160.58 c23271_g1_i1:687-1829(-)